MSDVYWVRSEIQLHHTDTGAIQWLAGILRSATDGIFESICPVTFGDDEDEDHFYDLCEAKWGTPLDLYPEGDKRNGLKSLQINFEDHGGTISLKCDTAWNPPLRIFEALRERGFHVSCWHSTPATSLGYWIDGEAIDVISVMRGPDDGDMGLNAHGDQVEVLLSQQQGARELDYTIHMLVRSRTAILKELDCIQRLSDENRVGADHCEASYLKGKRDALAWVSPKCHEAAINPDCTAQNQA